MSMNGKSIKPGFASLSRKGNSRWRIRYIKRETEDCESGEGTGGGERGWKEREIGERVVG